MLFGSIPMREYRLHGGSVCVTNTDQSKARIWGLPMSS